MNGGFLTATARIEISANVRHEVRICRSPQGKGTRLTREVPACSRDTLEVCVLVYVRVPLLLLHAFHFHFKWCIIKQDPSSHNIFGVDVLIYDTNPAGPLLF